MKFRPQILSPGCRDMEQKRPTIETFEQFCAYYEKGEEERQYLWREISFALKERERQRLKDKRYREKAKEEKAKLPPVPKKKPGPKGPWKHKRLDVDASTFLQPSEYKVLA